MSFTSALITLEPSAGPRALDELSAAVHRGQRAAIIRRSGVGTTNLVRRRRRLRARR